MRIPLLSIPLLSILLLATACAQTEREEPLATTGTLQLGGTKWRAEAIDGQNVGEQVESTLEFVTPDKVAGRGGCNQFGGPALVSGNTVRFGPLASTKMACAANAAMDQETRYFKALESTGSFRIDEQGRLVLVDEAGAERLRLARVDEKPDEKP
jgi:heat shock protein HslJ